MNLPTRLATVLTQRDTELFGTCEGCVADEEPAIEVTRGEQFLTVGEGRAAMAFIGGPIGWRG